ncbi:MAG: efflux RND transporter periplasmic adaptor subunit [Chitinispirillaceae bacterium]|nr:efflux RND transporter periplasmic adaptor subunit [Chitinispirillaceae bacterium]
MIKYILPFVLLVCLLCSKKTGLDGQSDDETVTVKVMEVAPRKFLENGIYFGMIEAVETANLVCYSGGRVEDISVEQGQYVRKGASLAKIDSAKAQSLLLSAKAQKTLTYSTLEQTRRHFAMGNASQLAIDQQHLAYLNAYDAYVDAQKNYRGCFAITPVSGMVTKKYVELFQEIQPGTTTFSVARLDSVKIEVGVTENDIYNVKIGSDAILTIPMLPDRQWRGSVKSLARAAGEMDRVFSAELQFENRDYLLKPGISGRVALVLAAYECAVVLPSDIIISEGIERTVMVVDSSSIARRRFIETGPQSLTSTMITDGLTFGERVISEGFQMVREGSQVKIDNAVTVNDSLSCQ